MIMAQDYLFKLLLIGDSGTKRIRETPWKCRLGWSFVFFSRFPGFKVHHLKGLSISTMPSCCRDSVCSHADC